MSSQMFCEVTTLDAAKLSERGGDGGKVHRVTSSVVDSRMCTFANDAPAGCWMVVRHQGVGAVLPQAEVLLVAVQAADTMWVLRAITRKTFAQAVEAESFDKRDSGGVEQAVMLAAALLPSNVLRVMPDRPLTGNALKIEHYARRCEMEMVGSGELASLGLPVELLAHGGFFPAELPAVVMPHVQDIERLAGAIRFDISMMSPQQAIPLALQEPPQPRTAPTARDAIAAGLAEGTPAHRSPVYRPMELDYDDEDGPSCGEQLMAAAGVGAAPGSGQVSMPVRPVVPLAAVPPAQAAAAGLPEGGARQLEEPERRASSGGSAHTISSKALREIQRQAGERCVALVTVGVPDAAARILGEAGCDVAAFYSMPVEEVVAACTALPSLQVVLLRRAHGKGQGRESRQQSRASSRPASQAGSEIRERPATAGQLGYANRLVRDPVSRPPSRAEPAPPLVPGPSPGPGVVESPPSPTAADVGALRAARAAMAALPPGQRRDAALLEIDEQLRSSVPPEQVAAIETALAAMLALAPGAARDASVAGLREQLAAAGTPAKVVAPPAVEAAWWARCVRPGCPCTSSYDGLPGRYCCDTCRSGYRCVAAVHVVPSNPAPEAARASAADVVSMQTVELLAHLRQVSTRAAELFAKVPASRLRAVWDQAYQILGVRPPAAEVESQRVAIALVGYQVNAALSQTGSTVDGLLAANARVEDAETRVCLVLQEIAHAMKPAGQQSGAGRAPAAAAGTADGGVLRRAVDGLAATTAAVEIQRLAEAVSAGDRTPAAEARLLGEVRDLQVGEHGAMVAMILQQEKLDARPAGLSNVSHLGMGVWSGLREVYRWLPGARERAHENEVPDGVDFKALVAAVARGQLSVAKIVPKDVAGEGMLRALQAGWPLLMALVHEALPRDATAMPMMRRIYVEACAGTSPPDAARTLITSYLEEMSLCYGRFTAGTDAEQPTFEAAHKKVYENFQKDQMRSHARREDEVSLKAVRERAAAAAERAAQARATAAAKEGAATAAPPGLAAKAAAKHA